VNPDGYLESERARAADEARGPLLLVHGMADDNVLFTHSTALMKRLQAPAGRSS
jgi:dipeptidyl-peptidase 4